MPSRTPIKSLLLLAALAALALPLNSAEVDGRSEAQLLRQTFVSDVSGEERDYFLFLPKGYETEKGRLWPVILFLHGGGERGDGKEDLPVLLKHGPLKEAWENGRDLPFIMIAPQMPPRNEEERKAREASASQRPPRPRGPVPLTREASGSEPRWDRQGPPSGWWVYEKDVLNMVDRTLKENRADADRVYVTGLSYGGFGTFHFAAAHPYRWAAVAPICGAADPDSLPKIAEAKLPIWIITGGKDRTVLPEWVLASAVALEEAGHPDVRFTVHEDRPHNVWTRVYEGWDLYNWFLDQRLK
jgi:predicted peptidase